MKSKHSTRKRMYVGCYNHINYENLKHNGMSMHQGGRQTRKIKKRRRKSRR